jgi:methionine-rich copper-binding protein CopC
MRAIHPILRGVLIFLGLLLFIFGVFDLLVPRARFVNSNPSPEANIGEAPPAVTASFNNKLAPESHLNVTSTIMLLPSGKTEYLAGRSVVLRSQIDPADPSGKSLRAELQPGLHKGLYWVNWTTTTAGWRTVTYGKTAFGVGMKVPEHIINDMGGNIWERTYDYRRRRAALVGGVVLIVLGLFLPMGKITPSTLSGGRKNF